eukprot:6207920-Pleurochrysis_carterae.AAC.3
MHGLLWWRPWKLLEQTVQLTSETARLVPPLAFSSQSLPLSSSSSSRGARPSAPEYYPELSTRRAYVLGLPSKSNTPQVPRRAMLRTHRSDEITAPDA